MERKANAIEVTVHNNEILVRENGTQSDDTFVCITASQAEQVCKWIMDAAYQIELDQATESTTSGSKG